MNKLNDSSIDGLAVTRRSRGQVSFGLTQAKDTGRHGKLVHSLEPRQHNTGGVPVLDRGGNSAPLADTKEMALPKPERQKIDIDLDLDDNKKSEKPVKVRKRGRKKIVAIILVCLLILGLGFGGYFAYKLLMTGGKIFKGNVVSAIFTQAKLLKEDENGRSNVLIFGTSEDDPGHPGGDLTDSIMVASISQKNKDVFLVSVPRDLYVEYDRACTAGYRGKINALYSCVKDQGEDVAQKILREKIGAIFGLDIQYSAHLNYTALRQAVDAVGGVTVVIESDDPRGILDRNFDWDCPNGPQTCYNVKYPNGPVTLNGRQALFLARARGDDGRTYGLAQSNFDREKYQRKILIALKDKAVSAGTLANPVKVNGLLDALGDNVRTSFDAEEIKTLVALGQKIKSENILSLVLNDAAKPLVSNDHVGTESVVRPAAGLYVYDKIQAVVEAYSTGDLASIEGAKIDVLNATGPAGSAQTKADEITKAKLTVEVIGNAPEALGVKQIQFYDLSDGSKPLTLKKLESLLGVKVTPGVPAGVSSKSDFVVVIGKAPVTKQ
jgi:polyisoprenyl-teichoic acid--peptidoglycan teichoic acid transferase